MDDLEKNVWSYWGATGTLPEMENMAISSWTQNLPEYNIHVVDRTELYGLVPPDYLPAKFDEMGDEEKAEVAGVALLRKYGGVYLSPSVIVDGNLGSVIDPMVNHGKKFICIMGDSAAEGDVDKVYGSMDPRIMATKKESALITRLNRRVARLGMSVGDTMKQLMESNKETINQVASNSVGMLDPSKINFLLDDPTCDKNVIPGGTTLFVLPRSATSAGPGSALRHLLDKNSVPGKGIRVRPLLTPGEAPTQTEKIPAAIVLTLLVSGMGVLLYAS